MATAAATRRPVALLAGALLLCGAFTPAAAGQWTRAEDDHLLITTVGFHRLDSDSDRPDLIKTETALYAEYGFTDTLTLIARGAAQSVHEAVPARRETVVVDGVETERVVEPEREFGVGGLELGARVRLAADGPWVMSAQGVFGVPGSGENQINNRFGEGGGDTDLRLQLGRAVGEGGFLAASGGWRNRRGEPRDEIRLDLTGGRALGRGVHIFVQSYSVWSVGGETGRPGGYSGHRVQASVLLPVSRRARLQVGALATASSRDMAREHAVLISLWRRF
ncbi:MAG: hypothetical protein ACFE0P_01935 [Oceanicaulis sp.]